MPAADARFTEVNAANAAIRTTQDRQILVDLDPDHPGFRDPDYRARRNTIARLAVEHVPGSIPADAPYTEAEHEVWRTAWANLDPVHASRASQAYLDSQPQLGLDRTRIPQLADVSRRLDQITGFRLEPVGGLVHPRVFLTSLGQGVFLSTQYIRHHSTPLYTPEPDVVHELIGHAGTLASEPLCELNRLVGEAAGRADSDDALERLGRVYWYTIEFGVLREDGEPRAYGAGLLSSAGELEAIAATELWPFDLDRMESTPYDVTQYQPGLFCADSFEHLVGELGSYLRGF
jgi:phenylalanine-4-hydroxylase